jgi:hypothetical protein
MRGLFMDVVLCWNFVKFQAHIFRYLNKKFFEFSKMRSKAEFS